MVVTFISLYGQHVKEYDKLKEIRQRYKKREEATKRLAHGMQVYRGAEKKTTTVGTVAAPTSGAENLQIQPKALLYQKKRNTPFSAMKLLVNAINLLMGVRVRANLRASAELYDVLRNTFEIFLRS